MATSHTTSIEYCNINPCKICRLKQLDTDIEFYSNLTGVKYTLTENSSCNSNNCIYLISCKQPNCHQKYVGYTTTDINKRLSGHRSNIINKTEGMAMRQHFTSHHSVADFSIKPIEFCSNVLELRQREKYWMRELNTIFPYGLNDRIDFGGIRDSYVHVLSNSPIPIYGLFNTVKKNRSKKGSGINRCANTDNWNVEEFFQHLLDVSVDPVCKALKQSIMGLSDNHTLELLTFVAYYIDNVTKIVDGYNEYKLYVIKDIAMHKLSRKYADRKKPGKNFIVVDYVNGLIDNINLAAIFNKNEVKALFPHNSDFCTPSMSYRYSKTIRSRITNYKKAVKEDANSITCNCGEYPEQFIDHNHGHIYTGDIDIIQDKNVKSLFAKGLNYRETQKPDIGKARSACQSAIDIYINSVSQQLKINVILFKPWKVELLKIIDSKLSNSKLYDYNAELGNTDSRRYLERLHKDLVITPIDKANNNIGFVCKYYYHQVLNQEIINSGNFVEEFQQSEDDIVNKVIQCLSNQGIKVDNGSHKLPFMYFTPKMHKNPPGHRFITVSTDTVTSFPSKLVSKGLKLMLKTQKNFSTYLNKYKVYNDYFITDNHNDVIKFMDSSNITRGRKSVQSYDFKTLYTQIPHAQLKENVRTFVHRVFQYKKKRLINITEKSAYFSNKLSSKCLSFRALEFLNMVEFLIDNSYIVYQQKVSRQIIGIPMGTNCAPELANIYLHVYEYNYIHSLVNNDMLNRAAKLSNMFRFQDDLIVFEDNGVFGTIINDIYPPVMELENTNLSANKVNYLDMTISVFRGKYSYKSFDKRNDFGFEIINYPDIKGNIPRVPAYGIFVSQLVRFCTINKNVHHFKKDLVILVRKLCLKDFTKAQLYIKFKDFCIKHLQIWCKFGVNIMKGNFVKIFSN